MKGREESKQHADRPSIKRVSQDLFLSHSVSAHVPSCWSRPAFSMTYRSVVWRDCHVHMSLKKSLNRFVLPICILLKNNNNYLMLCTVPHIQSSIICQFSSSSSVWASFCLRIRGVKGIHSTSFVQKQPPVENYEWNTFIQSNLHSTKRSNT